MGLDNGIMIKSKDDKMIFIPKRYYTWKIEGFKHYEIAYWRKCWGIREKILEILPKEDDEEYLWGDRLINRDDMKVLIKEMKKFTKRKYWDKYADSIWTFDEFKSNQRKIIRNLKYMYWYMKRNPEIEVYFYDSF